MGVDINKKKKSIPLPAPTETTESTTTTTTATDTATDVSRPNDEKSSYSLPEDGTPVTIKTRGHNANRSQTSLLIEYFEGGKGTGSESPGGRKPSVRVRLKPSGSNRSSKNDRIMISKPKSSSHHGGRKTSASYRSSTGHRHKSSSSAAAGTTSPGGTREIDISTGGPSGLDGGEDDKSISSYASATEESNVSRNPIVVEIDRGGSAGGVPVQRQRPRRPTSPLIPTAVTSSRGSASYGPGTQSELSAIPADSFLDGSKSTGRSESPSRHFAAMAATAAAAAGAAALERNRTVSSSKDKERVVFKSSSSKDKDRSSRGDREIRESSREIREGGSSSVKSKHRSSRSRNSSTPVIEKDDIGSPSQRRSSRHRHNESAVSGPDSSIVSSALSPSHRSYDQYSVRSGASKTSSINNPKLLETVEDAIRRLILPELNALKREHSRKDRRGSTTSTGTGTSLSREEFSASDRRKSGTSDRVPSGLGAYTTTTKSRDIRDREGRHDLEGSLSPAGDYVYESGDEGTGITATTRSLGETPKQSSDGLKTTAVTGAAGVALGGLAAAAMGTHDESESPLNAREQRRRRRAGARELLEEHVTTTTTTTTTTPGGVTVQHNPPDLYISSTHDDVSARSLEGDAATDRDINMARTESELSSIHDTYDDHFTQQPQLHERQILEQQPQQQHQQQQYLGAEPSYLQPPMPLMSEINSDITRSSILSAESDRPRSASEELQATPIHEVPRSIPSIGSGLGSASTPTPTTTPAATLQALGAQHANISHGDLRALPRRGLSATEHLDDEDSLEGEEFEQGGNRAQGRGLSLEQDQQHYPPGQYPEEEYDDDDDYDDEMAQYGAQTYDAYGHQIVPAPLKYVPYQPEHRGLSPIPSVSGYTEGGASEHQGYRDSILTTTTGSSPGKSPRLERKIAASPSSIPSNVMGRDFDQDGSSVRSSDMDYRASTHLTDSDFRAVNGAAANPNFVHTPIGVESAVASLVDSSIADGSGLTGDSSIVGYGASANRPRGSRSMHTLEEETSHGQVTPTRPSADAQQRGLEALSQHGSARDVVNRDLSAGSPATTRTNPSEFAGEYEIDDYGRKVRRTSPTASEAEAITAGAVGLAIQAARDRHQPQQPSQTTLETREISGAPPNIATEEWVPAGVQRNKSFKERTLDGRRPANTPTHSIDRLDEYTSPRLGASGLPDLTNPIPEIGYGYQDDDLETNPSVVHNRDVGFDKDDWRSGDRTPTQEHHKATSHGLGLTAAGAAAGAATAAAFASSQHSRQPSQEREEEWQRSSDERKRDTLITNPYEGTSPIVNESLIKSNLPGAVPGAVVGAAAAYGAGAEYTSRSPIGNRYDEGYISQGPNKSPDLTAAAKGKAIDFNEPPPAGFGGQEDPFYSAAQARHFSGLSQGMATPLYDATTGAGIDRIENKDIIALMQHLMVRDAQRSARDTEILVTLVRAAAEMRTSFENVKTMLSMHEKGLSNDFSKKLADSEDAIITEILEGTEKSVRSHVGGPRPLPGSGSRSLAAGGSQADMDDYPTKRQNIFRRALKSLNAKGNTDLGRIEDMLNQLLIQVDMLKEQSAGAGGNRALSASGSASGHGPSPYDGLIDGQLSSYDHDRGYEPEGHAGTSTASHASQSGFLSVNSRGGPSASVKLSDYDRKFSGNRISTVVEANEDEMEYTHQSGGGATTPRADTSGNLHYDSNASVPRMTTPRMSSALLATPPDQHAQLVQEQQRQLSDPQLQSPIPTLQPSQLQSPASLENTPRTDKGKRHKSSGSANWLPKISRWSETTTSSVGRVFRSSRDSKRGDELGYHSGPPSRSGSDLGDYDGYLHTDPEGADKLHSGFSETDLHRGEYYGSSPQQDSVQGFHAVRGSGELVPPDPSTYMTPEDPKYHAHRDSLNLQHPQPRSGQPFKATLESRAADFDSPTSPRSAEWAGSATSLHRLPGQNTNRYSDQSATTNASAMAANVAAREAQRQYWASSPASKIQSPQVAPPRPPKEPLDSDQQGSQDSRSLQTPSRSRLSKSGPKTSPLPFHSVESGYGTATHVPTSYTGSPRLENRNLSGALAVPTRRPSGPRAMTPKSEKSARSFTEEDPVSPAADARRRKRDTFGTITSQDSDVY